jgi:UTP--glucose-1-phosphate uridylyltransferase
VTRVRKAVIPAAGLGTRFLPATKAIPKEMIPIVDKPMIQFIVEEAVEAGIEEVIFITARHKEAIEDHFDFNYELEHTLESRGKTDLAKVSRDIGELCRVTSIRQKNPMGLGHAVACAEAAIGDEPFAILLGDDLIDSKVPCTRQLIDIYEKQERSVVGVMNVDRDQTSKYGIVDGKQHSEGLWSVSGLIEKPRPDEAPTTLAIPGRYLLTPKIFDCLRRTPPGRGGEVQLTDALELLAKEEGLFAYEFEGDRYDTGDRLGYIDATLTFALRRPELEGAVRKLMQKHLG